MHPLLAICELLRAVVRGEIELSAATGHGIISRARKHHASGLRTHCLRLEMPDTGVFDLVVYSGTGQDYDAEQAALNAAQQLLHNCYEAMRIAGVLVETKRRNAS